MNTRTLLAVSVFGLLVAPAFGERTSKLERASLQGLQGVEVVIETLSADAQAFGLRSGPLKTNVELQLRGAGIPVLTHSERMATPGRPFLYVNVSVNKHRDRYCFYIAISVDQAVVLARNPSLEVTSRTWLVDSVWDVGPTFQREVLSWIDDHVGKFIAVYRSANP